MQYLSGALMSCLVLLCSGFFYLQIATLNAAEQENLAAIINDAGSNFKTIVLSGKKYKTGTFTVPENITLEFRDGARILLDGDLTVCGGINAGIEQIFEGKGKVTGPAEIAMVYPQWFGAVGDGICDDTEALQKAVCFANTVKGRTLFIPEGRYRIEDKLFIRSNVECRGKIIKTIEIDYLKEKTDSWTFVKNYSPKKNVKIFFVCDEESVSLDPKKFQKIKENDFNLPEWENLPRSQGSELITLMPGGTLHIKNSDFFTSRQNGKGDQFYEKNDFCQIVSTQGDVFPEFCFSYDNSASSETWSPEKTYKKGDYCNVNEKVYKATWPSGPSTEYSNKYFGSIKIGPQSPEKGLNYNFKYANGSTDSICLWAEVQMSVNYQPPQTPLTVNGLTVEVNMNDNNADLKMIVDTTVEFNRSNMVINNLNVRSTDRRALLYSLCSVVRCANITFNNAFISGATFHGAGYNLLNNICSNITYNNCTSIYCRKGIAGRHGKNITVNGGYYNKIDDHYGRNYIIRNVTMNGLTTTIPGYCTPHADLNGLKFVPDDIFCFNGANFYIENCRVYNGTILFAVRGDVGDIYGDIIIKNIAVNNPTNMSLLVNSIDPSFDFGHKLRTPDKLVFDNISINKPNTFLFYLNSEYDGKIIIRNCDILKSV